MQIAEAAIMLGTTYQPICCPGKYVVLLVSIVPIPVPAIVLDAT
jgi:hypothetical protein